MKNWQTYLEIFCALPSIILERFVNAIHMIYMEEKELLQHPEEEYEE